MILAPSPRCLTSFLSTGPSSIEKSTVAVRKEPRSANPPTELPAPKREATPEQVNNAASTP